MSLKHNAELLKMDIVQALKDGIGFHDAIAESIAADVLKRLQQRWGGKKELYIPAADSSDVKERVRTEFNGRNHAEVCRKYNISLSTLYRYIG